MEWSADERGFLKERGRTEQQRLEEETQKSSTKKKRRLRIGWQLRGSVIGLKNRCVDIEIGGANPIRLSGKIKKASATGSSKEKRKRVSYRNTKVGGKGPSR